MADNVASVLNDLVETSKDGEQGFKTAADDTHDPQLRTTFRRHAQECARSAADLQTLVSRLGGKPEEHGSIAGAMHRGWVNLKSSVTPRTDLAILEERVKARSLMVEAARPAELLVFRDEYGVQWELDTRSYDDPIALGRQVEERQKAERASSQST